jgi:hypothetical protein
VKRTKTLAEELASEDVLTADTTGTFTVDRDSSPDTIAVHAKFLNENRNGDVSLTFNLDKKQVIVDEGRWLCLSMEEMVMVQVKAVQGVVVPNATLTASMQTVAHLPFPIFSIGVQGSSMESLQEAKAKGSQAAETAKKKWLEEHFHIERGGMNVGPDYDRIYMHSAAYMKPVADAIAQSLQVDCGGTFTKRAFINRTLMLTQSIPYVEARSGVVFPLALLSLLRGNCGSKTVLFLSIVKAQYPDMQLTTFLVPDHLFAGVAIDFEGGDTILNESFVGVEPVGPARKFAGSLRTSPGEGLNVLARS